MAWGLNWSRLLKLHVKMDLLHNLISLKVDPMRKFKGAGKSQKEGQEDQGTLNTARKGAP